MTRRRFKALGLKVLQLKAHAGRVRVRFKSLRVYGFKGLGLG